MHARMLWSTFWTKISVFEWLEFPLIIYISYIYKNNLQHPTYKNWKLTKSRKYFTFLHLDYIPHLVHRVSKLLDFRLKNCMILICFVTFHTIFTFFVKYFHSFLMRGWFTGVVLNMSYEEEKFWILSWMSLFVTKMKNPF